MHFTVKFIHCSGVQDISAAASVTYERDALVLATPAGEKLILSGHGTVYVMNENGRNVAVYRLGRARAERAA